MSNIKDNIGLVLKGGAIGIANIIPGVSGGTMAVVFGIYEQLIEAISNFISNKEKRKQYIIFLATIALGAGAAIIVFSWIMDYLLSNHEAYTYLFFIGLIAGSIPSIYKTHDNMTPSIGAIISFLIGFALIIAIDQLFPAVKPSKDIDFKYVASVNNLLLLFTGAVFAGGSMIVPGVSGSFILVVLGQYLIVIKAIKEFNFVLLAIIGAGAVIGVVGFAKLINLLLKKVPKETFYFILGLVVASLFSIFPGMPKEFIQISLSVFLVLFGSIIAFFLSE